jgi:hypothetical protein
MSRLALPAARVEMTDLTGLFVCACARGLRALAKPLEYLSSASSCVAGQRPRFEAMQPDCNPNRGPRPGTAAAAGALPTDTGLTLHDVKGDAPPR